MEPDLHTTCTGPCDSFFLYSAHVPCLLKEAGMLTYIIFDRGAIHTKLQNYYTLPLLRVSATVSDSTATTWKRPLLHFSYLTFCSFHWCGFSTFLLYLHMKDNKGQLRKHLL